MPTPDQTEPGCGASCLEDFARYLGKRLDETREGTLNAAAGSNTQYVVVHMYLVPGDVRRRRELREAIASEFAELHAVKLHDLAYAVPTCRGDEGNTAAEVWDRLIFAGADALGVGQRDAWDRGDVIYVHYVGAEGMVVVAAAPNAGQPLPQAITGDLL